MNDSRLGWTGYICPVLLSALSGTRHILNDEAGWGNSDMKPSAISTELAGYARVAIKHACPVCAGYLIQIRRRAPDRLLSRFVLMHRYRCPDFACQWEGNLRVRSGAAATMTISPG
jgi:hypothetical protein